MPAQPRWIAPRLLGACLVCLVIAAQAAACSSGSSSGGPSPSPEPSCGPLMYIQGDSCVPLVVGSDATAPSPSTEDAATDAGAPADTAHDATADAGSPAPDASSDASPDAALDASPDADVLDAAPDDSG